MLLIEIALEFSKYDLLILQIKQMTIITSLQSIKCSETVVRNNLEQLFFLKKFFIFRKKCCYHWEVCSITFNYTLTLNELKIMLTVIDIDYLEKSEKKVICIIIWKC